MTTIKEDMEFLLFAKWYEKGWISFKEYLRLTKFGETDGR